MTSEDMEFNSRANKAADPSHDHVQNALDEYTSAWLSGERMDPDTYCRNHPECGEALRKEIDDFLFVAKRLPATGGDHVAKKAEDKGEVAMPSGRTLGDFLIHEELGRGGMGIVYRAEQISLNRPVALKLLAMHLSLSEAAIEKFRREAEAGGRQSHPGIVSIYALGEHEGMYYIAQELVEDGHTLADVLEEYRKGNDLPGDYLKKAAEYIAQVADALHHAHASGVIHRDVKPSNILLTPEGRPKITDFGLAKVEDALALSRTGDFAGTPYYMSPEQAMSRRMGIDHRTDIFSLGVTLYEVITLERPFEGETSYEILKKIVLNDPGDPRRINPRIPRDLAVICLKAMEKKPEARYETMEEFAKDLRRFIAGDGIRVRPTGVATKMLRRLRRNPVISFSVCAAVLAVVALIMVLSTKDPFIDPAGGEKSGGSMNRDERTTAGRENIPWSNDVSVSLHRGEYAATVGFLGINIFSAWMEDDVRVKAKMKESTHCYLIAFNPDGTEDLCYPEDENTAPQPMEEIVFPDDASYFYGLTDGAGLQAFVLLESRDPLPAYSEWKSGIEDVAWQPVHADGVWMFDGERMKQVGLSRGDVRKRETAPEPFMKVCESLRGLPGIVAIRAVAFPVIKPPSAERKTGEDGD